MRLSTSGARSSGGDPLPESNFAPAAHYVRDPLPFPQAGMIEEMMEDTFESLEDDDLEEEADKEVDKILFEVTKGQLGVLGPVSTKIPEQKEDGVR